MSQKINELPFSDSGVYESEHLIPGSAYKPGDIRSSADPATPAFPRPTTYAGPPTAPSYAPVAGAYPAYSPGINTVFDGFGRQSPAGASPYSSTGNSPDVSAHSSLPSYEYAPQQPSSNPFMGSYSINDAASSTVDFSPWVNTGASEFRDTVLYSTDPMTLASQIPSFSTMTATSDSIFTDSDRPTIGEFSNSMDLDLSLQSLLGDPPTNKFSKVSSDQDVGSARGPSRALAMAERVSGSSNLGGSSEHGKTKLRSASRSSKNTSQRAGESADQRKTRNAHNIVEKQYRNRLNAQFEELLNALPESIRSPNGVGVGGPSNSDPNIDLGEHRLSKGNVLEMSTKYIKALERDCRRLERDREELSRNIERLQAMIGAQSSMQEETFSGG